MRIKWVIHEEHLALYLIQTNHSVKCHQFSPQETIIETAPRSWAQCHKRENRFSTHQNPFGETSYHQRQHLLSFQASNWCVTKCPKKRSTSKPMIINTKNICKVFSTAYNYSDMIHCTMSKWEGKWNNGITQIFQLSSASENHNSLPQEAEISC